MKFAVRRHRRQAFSCCLEISLFEYIGSVTSLFSEILPTGIVDHQRDDVAASYIGSA